VLLEAGARADAETSEGRTALHLAAMEGHDALTERLLAAHPELQSREDMHGWRALDYARERGWPVAGELLRSEDQAQRLLHSQWREYFEPVCRARLNVPACDAFLEIGRPHLLGSGASSFRLTCRAVDALGLLERFSVEIKNPSRRSPQCEEVVRLPAQLMRESSCNSTRDVELSVSLRRPPLPPWERLGGCRLRVVADLAPNLAARFNLEHCQARSPWAELFAGDNL